MRFELSTPERIIFGFGALREIGSVALALGDRVFIVKGPRDEGYNALCQHLGNLCLSSQVLQVSGEPSVDVVRSGLAVAREFRANLVIAIGGGSVLDAGKAIAGLLTSSGDLFDYLEVVGRNLPLPGPGVPFVAIPTTAGTGSEVTRNAVLSVPDQRVKVSLRSPHLLARVAIVDPDLTLSVPPVVTASTGMDALTQVIEPFVSRWANPLTDGLCREGMARAARSLVKAYHQGNDRAAREELSLASLFGGLALANAGLGAVHGFAAPLGGMFSAPHGAVCACLLPAVTRANVHAISAPGQDVVLLGRYAEMARILTQNDHASIQDGMRWLEDLKTELAIPGLASYGVTLADLDEIVAKAAQASSMKANPVALSADELREILLCSL